MTNSADSRFAPGHITVTALNASGGYLLSNWTADPPYTWNYTSQWTVLPTNKRITLSSVRKFNGANKLASWTFEALTQDMFGVLSANMNNQWSIKATIKTYNQLFDVWQYYWVAATLNEDEVLRTFNNNRVGSLVMTFTAAEEIT